MADAAVRAATAWPRRSGWWDRGRSLTEEALDLVAGSGVEASTAVVDALPADGLLALAEEHQARMIVIGTHGEPP
jgi:nucleotide-binding universal stress UspA family protein